MLESLGTSLGTKGFVIPLYPGPKYFEVIQWLIVVLLLLVSYLVKKKEKSSHLFCDVFMA